ncbi:DNA-binding protein (plasmid) [Ralstonia pseudosolanacearum]
MAGEAIITEELICKAAEQIASEGMRPTNETVRELLAKWTSTKGGSYATIGPVLRAWKARRKAAEAAEPVREAAPQAVLDKVQGWATDMWGVALELANGRLAAEREALDRARQELEAETAEALVLAEKREDERDEARRQAAEQIEQLNVALAQAQAEGKVQTERAAAAEARSAELEKRAAELHGDLSAERARRDEADEARRAVEQELAAQRAEVARLTQQAADQVRELADADKAIDELKGALRAVQDQARADLAATGAEHAKAQRELRDQHEASLEAVRQVMERELLAARKEAQGATAKLERVSGQLDALQGQIASQEATIRSFTKKGG